MALAFSIILFGTPAFFAAGFVDAIAGVAFCALGIPCTLGSMAGNQPGARRAVRIGARVARLFVDAALTLLLLTPMGRFFLDKP